MAMKRKERSEKTREMLLQTACEMMIRDGYENTTINHIAKACGVAVGTFYIYFQSKHDILFHILYEENVHIDGCLNKDYSRDPSTMLEEYETFYMENVQVRGKEFSREFFRMYCDVKMQRENLGGHFHQRHLTTIIEKGQQEGLFRKDYDADTIAHRLQDMNFGIVLRWCVNKEAADVVATGVEALKMLLVGLRQ